MANNPDSTPGDGYVYGDLPILPENMSLAELRTTDDPAIVLAAFVLEVDIVLDPDSGIITD
jgi:hypothetical protein